MHRFSPTSKRWSPKSIASFEHGEPNDEQKKRLGEVRSELDRYWDLLRQRRALREYGRDASEARERDADTVKKYLG